MEFRDFSRKIRLVCISDTHNQTPKLPPGDVLVHAGDLTNQGSYKELQKAVNWLESLDFQAKIVVAGNHDKSLDERFCAERNYSPEADLARSAKDCLDLLRSSKTITYLEHNSAIVRLLYPQDGMEVNFKVFGSPFSPAEGQWAFGYEPAEAQGLWAEIPHDTDIVVTHTPAKGYCDTASTGLKSESCPALREALWHIRPKLHICGHKHRGRGAMRVKWNLQHMPKSLEIEMTPWQDPGAGTGNKKISKVDLTARSAAPLRNSNGNLAEVDEEAAQNFIDPLSSHAPQGARLSGCVRNPEPNLIPMHLSDDGQKLNPAGRRRQTERQETFIVNAAYTASSYGEPKSFNKPVVVDIDLPV